MKKRFSEHLEGEHIVAATIVSSTGLWDFTIENDVA